MDPILHPIPRNVTVPEIALETPDSTMVRIPDGIWTRIQKSVGLPKLTVRHFAKLGISKPCFLFRECVLEEGVVLDGEGGAGKSVALLLYVAQRLMAKKPVWYLPNLLRLTEAYYPFYPKGESFYEQPELKEELLESYARLNDIQKPSTLFENTDSEAVLVVDQVNCLLKPTMYKDPDGNSVPVEQMEVLKELMEAMKSIPFIAATSYSSLRFRSTPWHQSQVKALPPLKLSQIDALLQYYYQQGIIQTEPKDLYNRRMEFLSGGLPEELFAVAQFDLLYGKTADMGPPKILTHTTDFAVINKDRQI